MFKLDARDQDLLAFLRDDARISVVELSRKLGVSRATVQNRMQRLEREGIVAGYTVVMGAEIGLPAVRALMSINANSADEAAIIVKLRGSPYVSAIHHTTGRWDLIVEIRTDSPSLLNQVVGEFRIIPGVTATETNLLLESFE